MQIKNVVFIDECQLLSVVQIKKCGFGLNFIVSFHDFDKNTGECLLKENQKELYSFTYINLNLQTLVDFNISFRKEFVLSVIHEREKEQN